MTDLQRIEQIIDRLKTAKSWDERYAIKDEYSNLIKSGLTAQEGIRAIQAATEFPLPPDITDDPAASLVGYLADSRFPDNHGVAAIPSILEVYPSLPGKARMYAVWLLMNIPEREGALAVMELVRRFFYDATIAFNSRYYHPLHADVYFPELLDYARLSSIESSFKIWNICLKYCEQGDLTLETIISRSGTIATEYKSLKTNLLPVQTETNWQENFAYLADRDTAGLLLDLMRFFPTDEIKQELNSALVEYRDPVLLCWACVSALWLGLPVDKNIIESIAADDVARKPFYGKLKEQKQTALFPEQYRTKAAFAQSDLVNWLTYPSELGHVPDAIELTHIVVEETEYGIQEWFLFRFRSVVMNDQSTWLAGWSGPFPQDKESGEILTPGGTFSNFHEWESKTPEEHLGLNDGTGPSGKASVIVCR